MDWEIFLDIHKDLPRQGSGGDIYTKKAFKMILKIKKPLILDIGCGPGLQTIQLAKLCDGSICAIDIQQQYLDQLVKSARKEKLSDRIKIFNKSMFKMDFPKEYFDIIWAEGSIYIIEFEKGLIEWKKFLKKDGYIAVHDITWLKDNPPKEIYDYWKKSYPLIKNIKENLKIIKKTNYKIIGYFPLPDDAWWELYYSPLENRLIKLKIKYKNNLKAMDLIRQEQVEIDLYRRYKKWYGSAFYVMQKKRIKNKKNIIRRRGGETKK